MFQFSKGAFLKNELLNIMAHNLWLSVIVLCSTNAWINDVALTPPMGWANWNAFACNYSESTIKQQSQALVDLGLRDVGFNLVIIQECIGVNRTSNGTMIVDPSRFPSGMPSLTDFIHSLDLKAGIYTDAGPLTCAKYVGSAGYEYIDAHTFIKEWGFDFIEDDNCYHEETGKSMKQLYTIMHDAIEATDASTIFYATCQGEDNVELWGFPIAHIQRTTTDIVVPPYFENVVAHFHRNTEFANGNGPGHWMGADMMVVGLKGLTETECKSHFSMWCIMAAPLWISTDLTDIEVAVLDILKNEEVIAVNQDEWGYG